MSAGDVAGLIAAIAFVLLVGVLAYPIIKVGRLVEDLRHTVQGVSEQTIPLLAEVTTTVSTTNAQLVRVDAITSNVQQVTTNVSALTSLFAATLGSPLVKVAAFSYGVRQAMSGRGSGKAKRARAAADAPAVLAGAGRDRRRPRRPPGDPGRAVVHARGRGPLDPGLGDGLRELAAVVREGMAERETSCAPPSGRRRSPARSADPLTGWNRRLRPQPADSTKDVRMETAEIRRRWLRFFEDRGHTVVPSASLVSDDPTLLFTVAGMVPFIPYLTAQQTPPWPRATSVQKCVRTLDIEEVGKTTRHATFFQMNGNFSFGDYFKEEAITFAWDLVTGSQAEGKLGFDPETVWATVFETDDEAYEIWRRVAGLPPERIQRRGMADNYWSTGVPGPAGPCSEIYIDRGPEHGREGGPVADEDRYLEIWNLVFMQDERGPGEGKYDFPILGPLPSRNIDTGMGLERVAYLLQGVDNLYEIDEVYPVLERAAEMAGKRYSGQPGDRADEGPDHGDDVLLRVVADHVRSALMLIGDGVTPGNEARGYVVRRLIRRAVRSMRLLGVDEPVLPELLPISRDRMSASYPELASDFSRISQVAYAEEEAFRRTLTAGTTILDIAVQTTKKSGAQRISGEQAFQLHDTYGFPIDLTLEMAAEQGVGVDEEGFRRLMTEQRERAKADARAKKAGAGGGTAYRGVADELGAPVRFTGYDEVASEGRVAGLLVDGEPVHSASEGDEVELVLDRTPFYAEGGGQLADAGRIELAERRGHRGRRRADAVQGADRAPGPGAVGPGRGRRRRCSPSSTSTAARRSAGRTRRPTWCTRRSGKRWGTPRPRPARRTRPAGSGSTSRRRRRCRRACSPTSRRRSTRCSPRTWPCTPR